MSQSSLNGVRLTVGLLHDNNRFQWTGAYMVDTSLNFTDDIQGDFLEHLTDTVYEDIKVCFAVDVQMLGFQIEPLLANTPILPVRQNFPLGTYDGEVSGDSTPSQTSILASYYSEEQVNAGGRTAVGKLFLGPAPESILNSGIIPAGAYLTALRDLAGHLLQFTGFVTGKVWTRALGPTAPLGSPPPAEAQYYTCTDVLVRTELYTQRRRMRPLL